MKRFFFPLFFLFTICFNSNAQNFLTTSGKAIVNQNQDTILLRGMGLGGWMLQEGYMLQTAGFANSQRKIRAKIEELIGVEDTDLFYEAWYANHVRKADIDALKSWGFNSVRLPMHYNLFTLPIEDEPISGENTWIDRGFEMTDSLISWCAANEMYVILDLHAAPGGQGYDEGISDYDPSKPSLWESNENKAKTVALWKRLAERYSDEEWVAGYDLLNEPNWDLPGGVALKNLYKEITDSIRTVDPSHIIFIEGNWFANDFTGLTPPWDDQLVYAPHKYWSINDQASMQWVIDIQNSYNVPLYLGESGENSNVWFADAIRLLEDLGIGWAWWPMKKVESISCPLAITKSADYITLLNYWSGNGSAPSVAFAKSALMQLTEDLKIENCRFQKDVVDAMFRQVNSEATVPFASNNVPGVVYSTDYDMGVIGEAYHDIQSANYNVSTGEYTSWNDGWAYRNDGVDIEFCEDATNTNGFNVGFLDTDEWMQYEIDVAESGIYNIQVRTASAGSGGRFHLKLDNADVTGTTFAGPTGGWQDWSTVLIENVYIDKNDSKLKFYVDQAGFNLNSFHFLDTNIDPLSLATEFIAGETIDEYSIQMNTNKLLADDLPSTPSGFEIFVNGDPVQINDVQLNLNNPRIIEFQLESILIYSDDIKISYSGDDIAATDGSALESFSQKQVKNNLEFVNQIPCRIQAENFTEQSGISIESSTDIGGGENVGYLDATDYMDYPVNIPFAGDYRMDFRHAAQYGNAELKILLVNAIGEVLLIEEPSFNPTGGWQSWETKSFDITLPEGRYTLRVDVQEGPLNINWFEVDYPTSVDQVSDEGLGQIQVYPNPNAGRFSIVGSFGLKQDLSVEIYDAYGRLLEDRNYKGVYELADEFTVKAYADGFYYLKIQNGSGNQLIQKLIKHDK